MVELTSRLQPNDEEVAAKVIEGEAIIINLTTGMYFSLDGVGALVWESFFHGHPVEDVVRIVTRWYQAPEDEVRDDVIRLANEFVSEGLMRPSGDGATAPTGDSAGAAAVADPLLVYAAPRLQKYADMADLLALDPPMPGLAKTPWTEPQDGG